MNSLSSEARFEVTWTGDSIEMDRRKFLRFIDYSHNLMDIKEVVSSGNKIEGTYRGFRTSIADNFKSFALNLFLKLREPFRYRTLRRNYQIKDIAVSVTYRENGKLVCYTVAESTRAPKEDSQKGV